MKIREEGQGERGGGSVTSHRNRPIPKMPKADTFQFVPDRGDAHLRLDLILLRHVTVVSRMSRTVAQQWIESGAVTVDGRPVRRPSARLREGATVEVTFPPSTVRRTRPAAEAGALDVLYEDAALIVVNKPPGVVVHPSYKQLSGTLLNAVLWRIRAREDLQPGIVTRLDKDTSGLVLVALTPAVHASLQREPERREVVSRHCARRPPAGPGSHLPSARAGSERSSSHGRHVGGGGKRDTIRGAVGTRVAVRTRVARAMRARDRSNPPDPRPSCFERLAHRRRSDLRPPRCANRKAGLARLASFVRASADAAERSRS